MTLTILRSNESMIYTLLLESFDENDLIFVSKKVSNCLYHSGHVLLGTMHIIALRIW